MTPSVRTCSFLRECWIGGYALRLIEQGVPVTEAQDQAERAWYAVPWKTRAGWMGVRCVVVSRT